MVIFFTCVFILITVFSTLHIYQVYRYNVFTKKKEEKAMLEVSVYRNIAMIVPCYNEEVVVRAAINNFSKLGYPNLKVIYVNDGSTDKTINLLEQLLDLESIPYDESKFIIKCNRVRGIYQSKKYANMIVVDKENGGKADSLNAAINLVDSDFIVTLDADSILKDDALEQINAVLQDPEVIATGGNIITSQGVQNFSGDKIHYKVPRKIVEGIQFIDYLKGFFITKNSYANLRALAVISGAFGVFKKDVMFEVGGFTKSIGEDIDITIKFHRYAKANKKKIVFNDKAMCFTEVPNNWGDFFKQRVRWQKGFIDAFKHHYKFLFKNILSDRLSFFMVFENLVLAYISIVCMLIGFYYIGYDTYYSIPIGWLMWIVIMVGTAIYITYDITIFIMASKSMISIEKKSIPKIIMLLIYEVFIYRQIMIVIYVWGSIEYFFKPHSWNKVARSGANNKIGMLAEIEELSKVVGAENLIVTNDMFNINKESEIISNENKSDRIENIIILKEIENNNEIESLEAKEIEVINEKFEKKDNINNFDLDTMQEDLISELKKAKCMICIAISLFTDSKIFNILKMKKDDGVSVRLIINDDNENLLSGLDYSIFEIYKLSKDSKLNYKMMKNRFCVIDLESVLVGQYDFISGKDILKDDFNKICGFENAEIFADKFMKLRSGIIKEAKFADSRAKVISQIKEAKYIILIAVTIFTDKEIYKLLEEKQRKGVIVKLIISNDKANLESGFDYDIFDSYNWIKEDIKTDIEEDMICVIDLKVGLEGRYNLTKDIDYDIDESINYTNASESMNRFMKLRKQIAGR